MGLFNLYSRAISDGSEPKTAIRLSWPWSIETMDGNCSAQEQHRHLTTPLGRDVRETERADESLSRNTWNG